MRAVAMLGAVALFATQGVGQNPEDMFWDEALGSNVCPGGYSWSTKLDSCRQCVKDKQSRHNSTMPCSFCPTTLVPNSNQSGCVCQEKYFNTWKSSVGVEQEAAQCTSCADVLVMPAIDDGMLTVAGKGKYTCLPRTDALGHADAQCECGGGRKGDAPLCPAQGFWLKFDGSSTTFEPEEEMPESSEDRAATFELMECRPTLNGLLSRCLHWSRCTAGADLGEEDDDPPEVKRALTAGMRSVYVSDAEFEAWRTVAGNADTSCPTTKTVDFPEGPNCCLPGYTGRLCEECVAPMMKIEGHCVVCDKVNWGRLARGTFSTLLFVLWMMRKSVLPFEDCNGKTTIVVFFVQTVNLIFRDRMGDVLDIAANYGDLSFYKHTKDSCTIPLTYYEQFFFDLFVSPCVMLLIYGTVLLLTAATSHATEIRSYVTHKLEQAARVTMVVKTLGKMHHFEMLSHEDRHVLARMLELQWFKTGEDIITEGQVPEQKGPDGKIVDLGEFYILTKGQASVKINNYDGGGLAQHVGTMKVGDYFGQVALLHQSARTASVTATANCECVCLSRQEFFQLSEKFAENEEFVKLFSVLGKDFTSSQQTAAEIEKVRQNISLKDKMVSALDEQLSGTSMVFGPGWQSAPEAGDDADYVVSDTRQLHVAQQKFVLMHQRQRQKNQEEHVNVIELRIKEGACCGLVARIEAASSLVHGELVGIYHACINPVARWTALLEICIFMYGPLTLQAMTVLFCKNVSGESYGINEPTVDCNSTRHKQVQMFACGFLVIVVCGVIAAMYICANRFYGVLDCDPRQDGSVLAQQRCGDHWKTMSKKQKAIETENSAHELRVQLLGSECFMMSALQMAVKRECTFWYPQWHLLRRTLLNLFYMGGLARGGVTSPMLGGVDWRVLVMIVLTISTTLQYHFSPFRDDEEDRLEMWGLQFIMIMVVADFGDETSGSGSHASLVVAGVLTCVFICVACADFKRSYERSKGANREWKAMRGWFFHDELTTEAYVENSKMVADKGQMDIHDREREARRPKFYQPWDTNYNRKRGGAEDKFVNPMLADEYRSESGSPKGSDQGTPRAYMYHDEDEVITASTVRAKFNSLDADGSGSLDTDEVTALVVWAYDISHIEPLDEVARLAIGAQVMKQLDANGDNKLTFEEAHEALRKYLVKETEYE